MLLTTLTKHIHPRLRYFARQVAIMVLAYLSVVGLVCMARGLHASPNPLLIAALLIGSALGAAFRPLPHTDPSNEEAR